MASAVSGKAKVRTMQCCNYSRGACHTSHSIVMPKLESAFIEGLHEAVGSKNFAIISSEAKKSASSGIDFDKLIAVEERRLNRAKEAYLAGVDTIEQYAQIKKETAERIEKINSKRAELDTKNFDPDVFANKVEDVIEFIEREDVSVSAKNEALHSIIKKAVYHKVNGELAIYFHNL